MISRNLTLDAYLMKYGKLIQQNAQASMSPRFVPGQDAHVPLDTLRTPFARQRDAISGAAITLKSHKGLFICAEMGTGKTLMGQLAIHAHAAGRPYRALVFCPGQLTLKWERELRATIPGCQVTQLNDWRDVLKLDPHEPAIGAQWYVISRDRAKLGARWGAAYITRRSKVGTVADDDGRIVSIHNDLVACPKCGAVQSKDDVPLPPEWFQKDKRRCTAETVDDDGQIVVCGEPLWSYNRSLDRWEPASYIKRKLKGFFRYLVLDEVHEEKSASSAQANAAGALISACQYTVALTGTLIGGYAEHLRPLLFRLCPGSITKEGFTWEQSLPFSERYGRIETRVHESRSNADYGEANSMSRGRSRSTLRTIRPGIVPTLVKHILGNTVFLGLSDVADNLPPLEERLIPVAMDRQMEAYYDDMEKDLTNAVKQAFSSGAKKMLGPMLNALLNWPDHPHGWPDLGYTDNTGAFVTVHRPFNFPLDYRVWPKEQALLDAVMAERAAGRQCWIYVQLTDKHDVAARLKKLLDGYGLRVEIMRSTVAPAKREAWITKHAKGADVVISHPKLVETGLDLFDKGGNHNFSTLIFYETGYNLFTMRQAARRSWRIGQHLPCRVLYMYYEDTMQDRAMTLMGRKLMAAEALEGKFSSEGLAALVGEDESLELALAKSLAEQASDLGAASAWGSTPVATPSVVLPTRVPMTAPPPAVAVPASAKIASLKAGMAKLFAARRAS
jgi:hypothetical protein